MKVCIYGAGAVGSHVAARLIAGGDAQVSVVARGPQLQGIRAHGLTLKLHGRELGGHPAAATHDPRELSPQDLVIVTLKTPALSAQAASIHGLLGEHGCTLFFNNGIPWWWQAGTAQPSALPLLDPQGTLWTLLREHTLGGICDCGNEVIAPGVVECKIGDRWLIGEPDGTQSPRLLAVAGLLESAGFPLQCCSDLRRDVWLKLLVNVSRNTLAALTRLPSLYLSLDDDLRALMRQVIEETMAVAAAKGWPLHDAVDLDALIAPGGRRPDQRPSMLQDTLAQRPIEVEALMGQVGAFAREAGVATPAIDVLLPLLRGLARSFMLEAR